MILRGQSQGTFSLKCTVRESLEKSHTEISLQILVSRAGVVENQDATMRSQQHKLRNSPKYICNANLVCLLPK